MFFVACGVHILKCSLEVSVYFVINVFVSVTVYPSLPVFGYSYYLRIDFFNFYCLEFIFWGVLECFDFFVDFLNCSLTFLWSGYGLPTNLYVYYLFRRNRGVSPSLAPERLRYKVMYPCSMATWYLPTTPGATRPPTQIGGTRKGQYCAAAAGPGRRTSWWRQKLGPVVVPEGAGASGGRRKDKDVAEVTVRRWQFETLLTRLDS